MGDTLAQDRFAMPEPFLGAHQCCAELIEVGSTKVLKFAPLEQIPHPFLGTLVPVRSQAVVPNECAWLLLVPENP